MPMIVPKPTDNQESTFPYQRPRRFEKPEPTENALLSFAERSRLQECERIITIGLRAFVEVGNALIEIRRNRLYRGRYPTFESYCRDKWNIKRQRAYELMDAAEIVTSLSEALPEYTDKLPKKEAHAAQLLRIPPDERPQVWKKVVEDCPKSKDITAKRISDTIHRKFERTTADVIPLKAVVPPPLIEEETQETPAYEHLLGLVQKALKQAQPRDIMVQVSGKWLIKNNLTEVWKGLRQIHKSLEITEDYKDYLTLQQAEMLGLIINK